MFVIEIARDGEWEAWNESLDPELALAQFEHALRRWPDCSVRLTAEREQDGGGGAGCREPRRTPPESPAWRQRHDELVDRIERAFAAVGTPTQWDDWPGERD